jgi:ParB-like chromosome segregation protein Spo0J
MNRTVRTLVKDIGDLDAVRQMEIENSRRKDLSPIEKGRKYRALVESGLMTQVQIAEEFHYTRGHISQLVSLTEIPGEVLDALGDPRDMTQAQGVNLLRAFRLDPSLRDRAIREVQVVKESGLPIEKRLAYFRDGQAKLGKFGKRAGEFSLGHRDSSGRIFAVLAHHGKRPVIRFDPMEEAFARYLWEKIPTLHNDFSEHSR